MHSSFTQLQHASMLCSTPRPALHMLLAGGMQAASRGQQPDTSLPAPSHCLEGEGPHACFALQLLQLLYQLALITIQLLGDADTHVHLQVDRQTAEAAADTGADTSCS